LTQAIYVGVDIGGSKVLAISADERLKILGHAERPHATWPTPETLVRTVGDLIGHVLPAGRRPSSGKRRLVAVGVAFPGFVDPEGHRILRAPNLGGWDGRDAHRILSGKLEVPVILENDANAAAWAEYRLHRSPSTRDLLFVILGTGIGAGLIVRGEIYRGDLGTAGEIGHLPTPFSDRRCGCGLRGCLETLAGGRGLALTAQALVRRHSRTLLARLWKKEERPGARELLFAAERGDRWAAQARNLAGAEVGRTIASAVNLLGVREVVLGGRLLHGAPHFFQAIDVGLRGSLLPILQDRVHLRIARDLHSTVAWGALLRARDHVERSKGVALEKA